MEKGMFIGQTTRSGQTNRGEDSMTFGVLNSSNCGARPWGFLPIAPSIRGGTGMTCYSGSLPSHNRCLHRLIAHVAGLPIRSCPGRGA